MSLFGQMLEPVTFWIAIGILLVVGEMLTMGFFLLFISLGCFAAALISTLGASHLEQALCVSLVSLLGILLFRRPIQKRLMKSIKINADTGKEITVDQFIKPGEQARIAYQGTTWMATNLDKEEIKKGSRAVIVGIDGNVLLIKKQN